MENRDLEIFLVTSVYNHDLKRLRYYCSAFQSLWTIKVGRVRCKYLSTDGRFCNLGTNEVMEFKTARHTVQVLKRIIPDLIKPNKEYLDRIEQELGKRLFTFVRKGN